MTQSEVAFEIRRPGALLESILLIGAAAPGISMVQTVLLLYIMESEGLRMSRLSSLSGFSMAVTSRNARSLAPPEMPGALSPKYGLVELLVPPDDGAARHILLTEAGQRLRDQLDRVTWSRWAPPGRAEEWLCP